MRSKVEPFISRLKYNLLRVLGMHACIFRVSEIAEEYDIIRRMLCPTCESPLRLERQTAMTKSDGRIKGDRMVLKCANDTCGSQIEVLFNLPEDYDPLEKYGAEKGISSK